MLFLLLSLKFNETNQQQELFPWIVPNPIFEKLKSVEENEKKKMENKIVGIICIVEHIFR